MPEPICGQALLKLWRRAAAIRGTCGVEHVSEMSLPIPIYQTAAVPATRYVDRLLLSAPRRLIKCKPHVAAGSRTPCRQPSCRLPSRSSPFSPDGRFQSWCPADCGLSDRRSGRRSSSPVRKYFDSEPRGGRKGGVIPKAFITPARRADWGDREVPAFDPPGLITMDSQCSLSQCGRSLSLLLHLAAQLRFGLQSGTTFPTLPSDRQSSPRVCLPGGQPPPGRKQDPPSSQTIYLRCSERRLALFRIHRSAPTTAAPSLEQPCSPLAPLRPLQPSPCKRRRHLSARIRGFRTLRGCNGHTHRQWTDRKRAAKDFPVARCGSLLFN